MTCQAFEEQMHLLLDPCSLHDVALEAHAAGCDKCRAELDSARRILETLARDRIAASPDFQERVMQAAAIESSPRARMFPRWLWAAAAAASLILLVPVVQRESPAVAMLAESVQAMSNVRSMHLIAKMRSPERDNFEQIDRNAPLLPVEIWKDFGATERWRVQKPGRVVVMDGTASTLLIGNDTFSRGGVNAGYVEWLKPLLDPQSLLSRELQAAKHDKFTLTEGPQTVLTVTRKAAGDFTNPWALNKSIQESDHTSVYRFDPRTKLLTGLDVIAGGVTVLTVDSVQYNEAIDPALFRLDIPPTAIELADPKPAGITPASPKEAAEWFFRGYAQQDWATVLKVDPATSISEKTRKYWGGLEVIRIGEAFQSGRYPGWFVPYEVRSPSGQVKKHNLAVRNDNPQGRWMVDGGW